MNEWRKVKLGEIINILNGYSFKKEDFSEYGIPVIKIKNIKSLIVDTEDVQFVNENFYEAKKKYRVNYKDILLSMTGSHISQINSVVGRVARMKKIGKYLLNQRVAKLVSKDKKILNEDFLYYFLSQEEITYQLALSAGGSANQANIGNNNIYELIINLPSIFLQEKIAKILSDIDEKIELNNKINNNLEKQVQLIFNNHFFNKDKNYTNYISSNLLEIADFLNGLAMQKYTPNDFNEKSYPVLKIKELNQGFTDKNSDRCSNKIKPEYIINNGDIIFSWSGTLLIKIWCGNKCGLNQHLFKVTSKKYDKWFYFLWINYHLKKFISIAKDKATTMGHIKRADLEKAFVLIPPEKEYESLNKILTPLFENIISNKKENNHLVNLKNYLLPKLMNGEIDIENIEL